MNATDLELEKIRRSLESFSALYRRRKGDLISELPSRTPEFNMRLERALAMRETARECDVRGFDPRAIEALDAALMPLVRRNRRERWLRPLLTLSRWLEDCYQRLR